MNTNIVLDSSLSISNSSSNNTSPIFKNNFNSIIFENKHNIIPACKYFPQYHFNSFIKDKLNALSPVDMEEHEIEVYEHSSNNKEIYVENISEGFESSAF